MSSEFWNFLSRTKLYEAIVGSYTSGGSLLFIDYCRVRDKYNFLSSLGSSLYPCHLNVIDGNARSNPADCENVSFLSPPCDVYRAKVGLPSGTDLHGLDLFEGFRECVENLLQWDMEYEKNPDINMVRHRIRVAFIYTTLVISLTRPKLVIIWNEYHPLSRAARAAVEKAGVPLIFAEYGVLPDTVNFDVLGQMGESSVARDYQKFLALPVNDVDLENADKALAFFRKMERNRREQPSRGEIQEKVSLLARGRPVIFFAGHNDFASGMIPYTDRSKRYHSPIFKSSVEAATALIDFARDNDWFLIYKPHPLMKNKGISISDKWGICVSDVNIHECIDVSNVTVTVLSQISYAAAIRGCPVVMLGYHQMRGKGVVYEVDVRDSIVSKIQQALSEVGGDSQKNAWRIHVAQLLKYYLYRWNDEHASDFTCSSVSEFSKKIRSTLDARGVITDFEGEGAIIYPMS